MVVLLLFVIRIISSSCNNNNSDHDEDIDEKGYLRMLMQSGGARYEIPTGRRDGIVSEASNVNLPTRSISVSNAIAAFANKGLNTTDVVLLLGTYLSLQCSSPLLLVILELLVPD